MGVIRDFTLTYFPDGTTEFPSVLGFENITNEYMVLMYSEGSTEVSGATSPIPIALLSPADSSLSSYRSSYDFSDGSNFEITFFTNDYIGSSCDGSVSFTYRATVLGHSSLFIDPSAKAYMDKNLGLSSGGSNGTVDFSSVISEIQSLCNGLHSHLSNVSDVVVSNSSAITNTINASFDGVDTRIEGLHQQISNIDFSSFDLTPIQNAIIPLSSKIDGLGKYNLLDLNGQFGSYRNGTKVLISGHTEEYLVMSSSLIWDDKMGVLMLTYDLKNSRNEICPCSHPLLTPVVVTPTTPTNGA